MPSKEIKKWVSSTTNHHSLVSLFMQSERKRYFAKSNISPSMSDISPELSRSLGGAMSLSLALPKECSCQCQARSTQCVHELYIDRGAPFGVTDMQDVEGVPRCTLSQPIPISQHWQSQKRMGMTKESSPTGESYPTGKSYPMGESSPTREESDYGQTPTRWWVGWILTTGQTPAHTNT
eukprot:1862940-Rhodomonas_salina.1